MSEIIDLQSDLIVKCKLNNTKAQMKLYDMYCTAMYNTAYNIVNREAEAQDIMQESFIKAFKSISTYNGEASFGSWLKRIVINNSLDLLKKKKIETISIDDHKVAVAEDDNWEIEEKIPIKFIFECIEKLPLKYKNVVKLYLLEGYDHQEVSQILKISEVASRSQLFRGKNKLKELLKSEIL
ncbi:MAG: sigma-70 family RNA polymerase sigma factor [Bacteroidota bacterium]